MKKQLLPVVVIAVVVIAVAAANSVAVAQETKLPPSKQTKLGLYVTAKQAYEQWKADPKGVKILDVRTPEEYIFVGHPEMAWNIPFLVIKNSWSADKRGPAMGPNEKFVDQVKKAFKPTDTILITCRSGGRSAAAVNILAAAGFKKVYTVTDGFEGDKQRDATSKDYGKRTVNGWKNSDIPWTYSINPELIYAPGE